MRYNLWDSDKGVRVTNEPVDRETAQTLLIRAGFTPTASVEILDKVDPESLAFETCGFIVEAVS